jgi:hypothetical protein
LLKELARCRQLPARKKNQNGLPPIWPHVR